jgi:uncharacterized protein
LRSARRIPLTAGAVGGTVAAYALFESQWVECNEVEVRLDGIPSELDGLRVAHLSDFHLGTMSLNARAATRAVEWTRRRDPDVVAITGDLLSRRRGEGTLRELLANLRARHGVFAVLGNHDIAQTRDPFADARPVTDAELVDAVLLADDSRSFERQGARLQVVGVDPHRFAHGTSRVENLADRDAHLRILLCHFPDVVERLPPGVFDLILAGHLHGGQISVPTPWGKLHLEHLRARYWEGLHRTPAGTLHVSRGVGASFVPFRFLARPEATILTIRAVGTLPSASGSDPAKTP